MTWYDKERHFDCQILKNNLFGVDVFFSTAIRKIVQRRNMLKIDGYLVEDTHSMCLRDDRVNEGRESPA